MTRTDTKRKGRSLKRLSLSAIFFLITACSDQTLSYFFDIPPPTPQEIAAEERARAEAEAKARAEARAEAGAIAEPVDEGPPPEIEATFDWNRAQELLPLDDMDQVDWVAALKDEAIKPRGAIGGARAPARPIFGFDFYLPGPDPEFDALFPHSVHTQWLGCESCHPAIFQYRGTEITMDDVFEGKYCGVCHGTVAFALDSCARCHTAQAE